MVTREERPPLAGERTIRRMDLALGIVLAVLVLIALVVAWRNDRSGALDDPGGMPGIGKSGRGSDRR